ncbi:hypothetical protein G7039_21690 [Rhizobium leguminosarum]|nr:hypothetical protein G7039_21690 [Rhizobium leguminosarum]
MAAVLTVTPAAKMTIPADPLLIAINSYRDGLAAYDAAEENNFRWMEAKTIYMRL